MKNITLFNGFVKDQRPERIINASTNFSCYYTLVSGRRPSKNDRKCFWPRDAAPWETEDTFYYPHRNDFSNYQMISDLKSVADCRAVIQSNARTYNDGSITTGDYECAIEIVDSIQGENVYSTTTR